MAHYDAIVLGTGGIGSAALDHLARRGCKVLGVDRFQPPHDRGSSHGQSRIIRQAYFEHPDYTPLLLKAYELWEELAQRVKRKLYHEVGVLQIGPPSGEVVSGVVRAAEKHKLSVEVLQSDDIEKKWPLLKVPTELVGVLESKAGYLLVEHCVDAHLTAAINSGAELQTQVEVQAWKPGPPVRLQTSVGELTADRLIVTAGAWASELLADLQLGFTVLRKSMFWCRSENDQSEAVGNFPCFLYELPEGVFYGMPPVDERGVKIAEHSGGQPVDDALRVSREVDAEDQRRVQAFLDAQLPWLASAISEHATCLYTMSRDGHFVVDTHPDHSHIVYAAGLSGHGFKFAPILGQALTDLALDGKTDLPIGFLRRR